MDDVASIADSKAAPAGGGGSKENETLQVLLEGSGAGAEDGASDAASSITASTLPSEGSYGTVRLLARGLDPDVSWVTTHTCPTQVDRHPRNGLTPPTS